MNGQWIGNFDCGIYKGECIVNVDELRDGYGGVVFLMPSDFNRWPSAVASFRTLGKAQSFKFRTNTLRPIDPRTADFTTWESVKELYPKDITFSNYADVEGSWSDESLTLAWTTDIGVKGNCVLPRSQTSQPSKLQVIARDWEEFKKEVAPLDHRKFIFRGQRNSWRLRTSYHRCNRADLSRYLVEDIPSLHRHLSARTRHVFNLTVPNENGAFFNLIQHHGYARRSSPPNSPWPSS